MTVLRNKVAVKHFFADLLYGDMESACLNVSVEADAFYAAIEDMKNGQPIFKAPKQNLKSKIKKLLRIGE